MGSRPFQIPGLSTLSQSPVDQSGVHSQTNEPAKDVPHHATPSTEVESMSQGTEHDVVPGDVSTAMDVDESVAISGTTSVPADVVAPESPPSLIQGLEAILGGLDPEPVLAGSTTEQHGPEGENAAMHDAEEEVQGQDNPEWEADSSPYESSSESSSSDDSDDEDDSDDDKDLLSPEEMARILMEAGSDDEGEGKGKGSASGGLLRTKNELPEDVIPKPDVVITAETKLEDLGEVEHIVESTIVVKAYTSGEYRVLDSGSVLFTEDRNAVAALADLIGTVREPRYTARFTNDGEIKSYNIEVGTKILYTPEHASFVFTEPLQAVRGTDASNLHDEEAGDDEVEFSDDEKEAAHKRELKEKRRARHGGRGGAVVNGRGGRGGSQGTSSIDTPASLNYDDDEDGPYRPLSRPVNFGQGAAISTTFTQGSASGSSGQGNSPSHRGGRGDFRGRGRGRPHDRGGRGNRDGFRGGSGQSLPPRSQQYPQQSQPQQQTFGSYPVPPPQFGGQGYPVPPPPPQFYGVPNPQQSQTAGFPAWPQSMPPNFVPPPPPQFQQQQQQPPQNAPYFNQAIYAALQNQFQGQNGGNQQSPQWPHQGGSG